MDISVDLHNPYCAWHVSQPTPAEGARDCQVWVRGQAWDENTFRPDKELATWLGAILADSSQPVESSFETALGRLNGSYALVAQTSDRVLAAVDRLRSIPLFYGTQGNAFLLSDNPYAVRRFVGDVEYDDTACLEFLLTGYVTGTDTLSPNVKQIQAGEYVVRADGSGTVLKAVRTYRFVHGDYFRGSELELYEPFEQTLLHVFGRLAQSVGGRRIVVPLSGGLDSRLIATMLRRLGVENVMCFSYGSPGNWESAISRQVAEQLGFDWNFVPYTRRRWRRWFQSEQRQKISPYCGALASLPHLQDWAAIWELKKAGFLRSGDVIVPGHAGDFIAGGHIPPYWAMTKPAGPGDAVQAILQKHYSLWNWRPGPSEREQLFTDRVADRLEENDIGTTADAASAFEKWDWQERQAKYITNSIRVYEFWGYDWRLPLWDHELMSFWQRVPLEMRVGKKLWDSYLETQLFPRYGVAGFKREDMPGACWHSTVPGRNPLIAFRDRQLNRLYRTSSPYLGSYSVIDCIEAWRGYSQRYGNGWKRSTANRLLNMNTIHAHIDLQRTLLS